MSLRPDPRFQYRNPFTAIRSIYATEGTPALFRGVTVVALGAYDVHVDASILCFENMHGCTSDNVPFGQPTLSSRL